MFAGAWSALVTPFCKEKGLIDYNAVRNLLVRQIEGGIDGVVIGGTTGESPTLSQKELMSLIDFAVKEGGRELSIMAGTGTNSTEKTIQYTKMAKDYGAKGALVIVPYYNKPTDRGVIRHFEELSKLNFPLMVYHHPGRTGVFLSSSTLAQLSEIDAVVGIKEASGAPGFTKEILLLNPGACILSGDDELAIETIKNGAVGSISIIANLYPAVWKKIIDFAVSGEGEKAKSLYSEIEMVIKAILLEVNPQGIKCALAVEGFIEEVLRLPLVSVEEVTRNEIKKSLIGVLKNRVFSETC